MVHHVILWCCLKHTGNQCASLGVSLQRCIFAMYNIGRGGRAEHLFYNVFGTSKHACIYATVLWNVAFIMSLFFMTVHFQHAMHMCALLNRTKLFTFNMQCTCVPYFIERNLQHVFDMKRPMHCIPVPWSQHTLRT